MNFMHKVINFKNNKINGFTLIELLIVIGVMGVLASAVIIVVDPVAQLRRARDTQRKSDIRQIQSALEMYRADNGSYPASIKNCNFSIAFGNTACTTLYMSKVLNDPSGSIYWNTGNYYYSLNGTGYTLAFCIENSADKDSQITAVSPGGSGTCISGKYYVVNNP